MQRCLTRPTRVLAVALCFLVLSFVCYVPSASAGGKGTGWESCSGGSGEWRLRVDRRQGGRLRVRFDIEDDEGGQAWHVFLSKNGTRIFAGTRRANDQGRVHVTKATTNRPGRDRVAASGVNGATGATCEGSLRY